MSNRIETSFRLTSPAEVGTGGSAASGSKIPHMVAQEVARAKARRPMSVPLRRLETTQIPGFYLHWIKQENLAQAYAAHYQHVTEDEVAINSRNVALGSEVGATSDLSDRVSVQYGGDTLFLMKLEDALHNEDLAILGQKNAEMLQQIFRGEQIAGQAGVNPGDTSHTYIKEELTHMDLQGKKAGVVARADKPLFGRKFK